MLYQFLQTYRDVWADRQVILAPEATYTFGELGRRAEQFAAELGYLAGESVGLAWPAGADWVALAAAMDGLRCRTFLLGAHQPLPRLAQWAEQYDLSVVLAPLSGVRPSDARLLDPYDPWDEEGAAVDAPAARSSVMLFTSGTSGQPKVAVHDWSSLSSGIHQTDALADARMLLSYDITRYAGLQVLLTAILNASQLVVPADRSMTSLIEAIVSRRVNLVSGTPTFWRMLLAESTPQQRRDMVLRQITLGGEAITQPTLDALRATFPKARLTHIYASTEMGVCFSVHDGREGFPASFLDNEEMPVRLTVRDGRLLIRSKRSMAGYLSGPQVVDEWFDTGDAVEQRGDRVHFRGRESSRINVGGEKVYPEEVEAAIHCVYGVAEVRVSGVDSSIMGQLVQAEVVPTPGVSPDALRSSILRFCRENLAAYKQPCVIRFVERLVEPTTLKLARHNGS